MISLIALSSKIVWDDLSLPSASLADLSEASVPKTELVFRNALREAAEQVFGQWCSQLNPV